MRVGLFKADGKWANLALMKVSAWHKKRGDEIDNYIPSLGRYDKIYMSEIFDFSKRRIPEGAEVGGSGFDLKKTLPDEIENCFPDYSLYPDCDYALGFTTRGCNRKCSFCIVPKKEGKLKVVGRLKDFYAGQKEVRCLDNNITMAPIEHFEFTDLDVDWQESNVFEIYWDSVDHEDADLTGWRVKIRNGDSDEIAWSEFFTGTKTLSTTQIFD